jgi:hypothetical protein
MPRNSMGRVFAHDAVMSRNVPTPQAFAARQIRRFIASSRGGTRASSTAQDDKLRDVVEALKAATSGDSHETGVVQVFERGFAIARAPPSPPAAGALAGIGQFRSCDRSAFNDLPVDSRHVRAKR